MWADGKATLLCFAATCGTVLAATKLRLREWSVLLFLAVFLVESGQIELCHSSSLVARPLYLKAYYAQFSSRPVRGVPSGGPLLFAIPLGRPRRKQPKQKVNGYHVPA